MAYDFRPLGFPGIAFWALSGGFGPLFCVHLGTTSCRGLLRGLRTVTSVALARSSALVTV